MRLTFKVFVCLFVCLFVFVFEKKVPMSEKVCLLLFCFCLFVCLFWNTNHFHGKWQNSLTFEYLPSPRSCNCKNNFYIIIFQNILQVSRKMAEEDHTTYEEDQQVIRGLSWTLTKLMYSGQGLDAAQWRSIRDAPFDIKGEGRKLKQKTNKQKTWPSCRWR